MSAPQYLVRMSCVVTKLVTCENCTEEQAAQQPWNFCTDEQEIDMQDWTVLSVERDGSVDDESPSPAQAFGMDLWSGIK